MEKRMALHTRITILIFSISLLTLINVGFLRDIKLAECSNSLTPEYFINAIDLERIKEHVYYLSNLKSRVTGYPGSYEAAQYIYKKFLEYNLSNVRFHNYSLTVPIDYGARIEVLSSDNSVQYVLNAYTLWPNSVQTSPTPPDGLTGELVYVGYGEYSDFQNKNVSGKIVLMEFNSRDNWRKAFELGAKAVIFIEPEDTSRFEIYSASVFETYPRRTYELKHLSIPLYAPRLLLLRSDGLRLLDLSNKGLKIRVFSNMRYEVKEAFNVIGMVNGTGLAGKPELANEIVIISAKYDSFSIVPALSPGADEAIGVAVLLEIARLFKANPPARTVMFLATSGHDLGLEGARWFVEDLMFREKFGNPNKYRIFIGLELSSESPEIAGLISGYFYRWYPQHGSDIAGCTGIYSIFQNEIIPLMKDAWRRVYGKTWEPDFSSTVQRYWQLHNIPPGPYLPSEVWTQIGMSGFSFVTRLAPRIHYGTWLDTYDLVNFNNVRPQAEFIAFSTYTLLCSPEITGLSTSWSRVGGEGVGFNNIIGQVVEFDPLSARYKPVPNALVHLWLRLGTTTVGSVGIAGARESVIKADENGRFIVVGLGGWVNVRAYVVNSSGAIIYAPDFGEYGEAEYPTYLETTLRSYGTEDYPRYFVVFKTGTLVLYNFIDPRSIYPLSNSREVQGLVEVLDVRTHARPTSFGYVGYDNILMVFVPPSIPIEVIVRASTADTYPILTLTNWCEKEEMVRGYSVSEGEIRVLELSWYRSAHDLYRLVESRKITLNSVNVINPLLDRYFFAAKENLEKALLALKSGDYGKYTAESIFAWQNAYLAYLECMQTLNGVINTTIFFFILLIPFAFTFERLFVHGQTWKTRVGTMVAIFIICTLTLSMFHPGFRLASNIYMVLIGFVALVFAFPLIFVILGELAGIFSEIRRKIVGEHFAEISRVSAVITALSIGVENMRRRGFRTILTLVSVSIVSMCLVTFTSFSSTPITRTEFWPEPAPYIGIMFKARDNSWSQYLSEWFIDYCKNVFPDKRISYRVWMRAPTDREGNPLQMPILSETASKRIFAVLGITYNDVLSTALALTLKTSDSRLFSEYDYNDVLLPDVIATDLNVKVGDLIKLWGYNLTVRGIYDSSLLDGLIDLDRERITPLDPSAPAVMRAHLSSSSIVIVPARFLLDLGGVLQMVSVEFANSTEALTIAKEIAQRHTLDVYVGSEEGIHHVSVTIVFSLFGIQYLIIPILMACLTILNMALASVIERIKDIFIYSSIGLSPLHIAGIFLSESVIYAIISGILGYIFGVIGIQMGFLFHIYSEFFYPNFTSSWIIIVVSLTMLASILSSTYPAYKVSKMVTPSLERKWKLTTKPIGDNWEVSFPFLIPSEQVNGLLKFLAEYASSHSVEGIDSFTVSGIEFDKGLKEDQEYKTLSM
ncbi:MAG: M28 family peptidase, partial [Candidatus Bathyarchaeia archaeon]